MNLGRRTLNEEENIIPTFFGCQSDENNTRGRKISYNHWYKDDRKVANHIIRHYHNICSGPLAPVLNKETANIPKQIHFIWFGPKPIPQYTDLYAFPRDGEQKFEQCKKCWNETTRSWKIHHSPDDGWEFKLWDEDEMKKFHEEVNPRSKEMIILRNAYSHALDIKNYGMASDIARLEILYVYGGLYVDVDYYCFRSFDDLHQLYDFYCGASNTGVIEFNNGLMGCIKYHILIYEMIKSISTWFSEFQLEKNDRDLTLRDLKHDAPSFFVSSFLDDQSLASLRMAQQGFSATQVIENTGPGLLTRSVLKLFHKHECLDLGSKVCGQHLDKIMICPAITFHALPNNERQQLDFNLVRGRKNIEKIYKYVDPVSTRALHLWSCSWQNTS